MKTSARVDISGIKGMAKKLDPKSTKKKEIIKKALYATGFKLIEHAATQFPAIPVKDGDLRGAFNVIVDKNPVKVDANKYNSASSGKSNNETKAKEEKPSSAGQPEYSVRVWNGMPYALYIHEGMTPEGTDYSPGEISQQAGNVGGGFVSRKILDKKNQAEYKEILAGAFK